MSHFHPDVVFRPRHRRLAGILYLVFMSLSVSTAAQDQGMSKAVNINQTKITQAPLAPSNGRQKIDHAKLLRSLDPGNEIPPAMKKLKQRMSQLALLLRNRQPTRVILHRTAQRAIQEASRMRHASRKLEKGFHDAQRQVSATDGAETAGMLTAQLDDFCRVLEAQDKIGKFELDDLMSRLGQVEQLATSVMKKKDETASRVINNVR